MWTEIISVSFDWGYWINMGQHGFTRQTHWNRAERLNFNSLHKKATFPGSSVYWREDNFCLRQAALVKTQGTENLFVNKSYEEPIGALGPGPHPSQAG